ncbi:hypothetical protein [Fimbriiglobus ruber]|uniref:Uncharacterized protein n=1 Tax=Fimbriiglobus ruber TaxID=1908690 RepID=A0A225D712_9BACT|nr:hypothetical protein [Fimbriiglobus ruber]OWK34338.1 hypothetical protein FRUB_10309 [Fimbriiglobus ruber]
MNDETTKANVAQMTTGQLVDEFDRLMRMSALSISRLAAIWCELEDRGVPMAKFKCSFAKWLPMVGTGRLHPGLVAQYAGRYRLLTAMSEMNMKDQKRLAKTKAVAVFVGGDEFSRDVDLDELSLREIIQVFNKSTIRTPEAQKAVIHGEPKQPGKPEPMADRKPNRTVKVDPNKGVVAISNSEAPLAAVCKAIWATVNQNSPPPTSPASAFKTVVVRLYPEEFKAIEAKAKAMKVDESEVLRLAARVGGVTGAA